MLFAIVFLSFTPLNVTLSYVSHRSTTPSSLDDTYFTVLLLILKRWWHLQMRRKYMGLKCETTRTHRVTPSFFSCNLVILTKTVWNTGQFRGLHQIKYHLKYEINWGPSHNAPHIVLSPCLQSYKVWYFYRIWTVQAICMVRMFFLCPRSYGNSQEFLGSMHPSADATISIINNVLGKGHLSSSEMQ